MNNNTQDDKVQLTSAFPDVCQLHQVRRPGDVVWDVVQDGDDEPPPLLGLSAFTFFLMVLSHTGGKLYLPPSLMRLGLRALPLSLCYPEYEVYKDSAIVPCCFVYILNEC